MEWTSKAVCSKARSFAVLRLSTVWSNGKNADGLFEDRWQGSDTANTASHASGIDVLVAAAAA
jgi:hypothetical protein